jgi:hypothetical protein
MQRGMTCDWYRVADVILVIIVVGIILVLLLWPDVIKYQSVVNGSKNTALLVQLMQENNELLKKILEK